MEKLDMKFKQYDDATVVNSVIGVCKGAKRFVEEIRKLYKRYSCNGATLFAFDEEHLHVYKHVGC
ncbi:hypothetical protein [Coprobacter fastidiosus]|uniref:hypothetical protein n=1 Tax=Coprobacter fastidiosus TaxID=1099853 RepID=UPI00320BB1D8